MSDFSRATIYDRFYTRVAETIGNSTKERMLITTFKFGASTLYVDRTTTPPTLLPIPDTAAGVSWFFTGQTECIVDQGRVLVRCRMPAGSLVTPQELICVGIFDTQNNLIAMLQSLPDWLTPTDEHVAYGYLDFPNLGANPPTAPSA